VIHDHAELELAAAAIDFELTPAERARLEKAIAECSVCARGAASYRRQANLLQSLPVVDASLAVRRNVERAVGVRQARTSWTWALLAAAMLGLLLTSALVVGAIDQNRRNGLVDVAPSPTMTETPSPSVAPSELAPDVIALDPPSGDLADVGPPLGHDSMATVVTTNLRIRSAPFVGDASVKYRRLLQPDDRLFVIDGPVIGGNYEWYQVKAWRPGQPAISWPVGWVARAGHDGEVWFQATTVRCPVSPMSIEALASLAPAERLACFDNRTIDVRAVVGTAAADCGAAHGGCPTGPAWLASTVLRAGISSAVDASGGSVPIALDPASGLTAEGLEQAGVVRMHGAFDSAASKSCVPDPDRAGPDGPLSPVEALLACRTQFAVTETTPETFPRVVDGNGRTVSDRLRVRSLPEISAASIKYDPLLPLGTKVSVVEGPVLGDGYAWYRVTASVSKGSAVTLAGWVAAAGLDGERWLEVRGPAGSTAPASTEPSP
jgi:hypothetical protein